MDLPEEKDELAPGDGENVTYRRTQHRAEITFFYEGKNGLVFAASEKEAASREYNKKLKYLGWSDGKTHERVIGEAKLKPGQVITAGQAKEILGEAFKEELKVAKLNLSNGRKTGEIIVPKRVDWFFDNSVPVEHRVQIAGSKSYGGTKTGN